MKLSFFSKLSDPSDEQLSESELCDRYQLIQRKYRIGIRLLGATMGFGFASICAAPWMADVLGVSIQGLLLSSLFSSTGLMFLGASTLPNKKQWRYRPLVSLSDQDRSEALRLIRSVPEARRLSEQARESGRSLRMFDLEKMREFQKERDAKLLARESYRLGENSRVGRLKG